MYLCMRTTIDIPDALMKRVKQRISADNMTFRALVISALESALEEESKTFQLRDASVGDNGSAVVSSLEINEVIDQQRYTGFQP